MANELAEGINSDYIRAIFNTIGLKEVDKDLKEKEKWRPVDFILAQSILIKYSYQKDLSVANSFCRTIENRANEIWNDEILSLVCLIAQTHEDPLKGRLNVHSSTDKEDKTINTLHSNSMNCARGCAAQAIASLLWADNSRFDKLKDAIESTVYDYHLAVNMASIECLAPSLNINFELASKWFFTLAEKDIRLIAHPYAYDMFYYILREHQNEILELVVQMYQSDYEDVSEIGARHIANMNLLYGFFDEVVFGMGQKTKIQKMGILNIAISLLKNNEYHEKCKRIINLFLKDDDIKAETISSILYNNEVNYDEDLEFIREIVVSKSNVFILHCFIDFIKKHDISIVLFKDLIFDLCKKLDGTEIGDTRSYNYSYDLASDLSKLIANLYDSTADNYEINQQCLDMWDFMYQNRFGTIREISESIMNC